MDKRIMGLYNKFTVRRTDGKSAAGAKHDGCDYFVLDMTHDPHAYAAILAYAYSCEADYPQLAKDLRIKAQMMAMGPSQYFNKTTAAVVSKKLQKRIDTVLRNPTDVEE